LRFAICELRIILICELLFATASQFLSDTIEN